MTGLRLDKLTLTNFRCFADCEIALHPRLTVLVAENGSGKTAVLDAAALALSAYVSAIYPAEKLKKIERTDIRVVPQGDAEMVPRLPTVYVAQGLLMGQPIEWSAAVNTYAPTPRQSARHLLPLQQAAQGLRDDTAILPLVAFYGTSRLWREDRQAVRRRTSVTNVSERLTGYAGCLNSSSSFTGVSTWYETRVVETAAPAYKEELATNLALLTGVREAARIALAPTGWENLDWDTKQDALVADHPVHGRLPLSSLSDGVRNMLALVADVARRCASLNPHLSAEAARLTSGILLIDEVDMHLHPRWQQLVIELLRQAFPAMQIIASTHSPHVLSTVDKSSIRIIRSADGATLIETPLLQTRGVQSADVLSSVMGVDPTPQLPEADKLSGYRALIEDGKAQTLEAMSLRAELVEHFGEKHPVILDCDRLIRFQEFRLRRESTGGGA